MKNSTQNIYQTHHLKNRPPNFSILKDERSELLKKYIGRGKKVLDVGCRDGTLTKYFTDGNDVLGADIDEIALSVAKSNLGIRVIHIDLNGDWRELKDEKFDVIVAGEVLEHLYYPEEVIKKVIRHLNPGGKFVGSVPNAFSIKNRLRYLFGTKRYTPLSDPTHINQFHIVDLRSILRSKFNKVSIIGLGRYPTFARLFPGFFAFDLFWECEIK